MSISREERLEFERDIKESAGIEAEQNDIQVGGDHYKKNTIQTWDFIHQNNIGFIAGNIIKYVVRFKDKNGIEDLKKARHYLDKLIEMETSK